MTMRLANAVTSWISEPPKPRWMILNSGKSCAKSFHKTMLELPAKTIAPVGGGVGLSAASNALMAVSHLDWPGAVSPAKEAWENASRSQIKKIELDLNRTCALS